MVPRWPSRQAEAMEKTTYPPNRFPPTTPDVDASVEASLWQPPSQRTVPLPQALNSGKLNPPANGSFRLSSSVSPSSP
jgi:hypothetical protein